jgi:hypothetical protein
MNVPKLPGAVIATMAAFAIIMQYVAPVLPEPWRSIAAAATAGVLALLGITATNSSMQAHGDSRWREGVSTGITAAANAVSRPLGGIVTAEPDPKEMVIPVSPQDPGTGRSLGAPVLALAGALVLAAALSGSGVTHYAQGNAQRVATPQVLSGAIACGGGVILRLSQPAAGLTFEGWFDGGWRPATATRQITPTSVYLASGYARWRPVREIADGALSGRPYFIGSDQCERAS